MDSLHSLFLAQAIGLYLVIIAIIMVARGSYYQNLLSHYKGDSSVIVLAASLGLILGVILIIIHNIWVWDTEILITFIAWFLLIKSILWLSLPEYMVHVTKKMNSGWGYYVIPIISAIIGVLLMAYGFYKYQLIHF
ncbi:hypothetical protein TUM19329_13540 [Legionella antarctica]|uniref:Integral membrane protein (PIN domain superfamily) n=1 Tax=Legionella antarctica TaxID=2708020 RepID=A0A6F8T461_9GAMM|nr:hypothetical protein [Legionella antarctica]BCA94993.1 hypothetical protein TUM19329_13540 [Legionella antarctica]